MSSDVMGDIQDIIVSGVENNSAPVLNVEVNNFIEFVIECL